MTKGCKYCEDFETCNVPCIGFEVKKIPDKLKQCFCGDFKHFQPNDDWFEYIKLLDDQIAFREKAVNDLYERDCKIKELQKENEELKRIIDNVCKKCDYYHLGGCDYLPVGDKCIYDLPVQKTFKVGDIITECDWAKGKAEGNKIYSFQMNNGQQVVCVKSELNAFVITEIEDE